MRKTRAKKHPLDPDPQYNDTMVTRFVNGIMQGGNKSTSYKVFYDCLDLVEKNTSEKGYDVWKKALNNIMPSVEVKSRRIGGSTFQIPTEVRPERKVAIGMKWLIDFSKKRSGRSMADKLANEIIAASKGEGAAVKKKEDTHRMAEANKAFSHYRV